MTAYNARNKSHAINAGHARSFFLIPQTKAQLAQELVMNLTISISRFFGQSFAKTLALAAIITGLQALAVAAQPVIAVGPDARHVPLVKRITVNAFSGNDIVSFAAYRRNFTGGVRVAVGDVNGDGAADIITGPGPGMGSRVNVFDGVTGDRIRSFLAFTGFYRGGVFVAAGDVNGDGKADIIVGTDSGAPPIVRIFDGAQGNLIRSFFAYSPLFTGGVRVAAGDVNGDGLADIITGAGPGAGPLVKVFESQSLTLLHSLFAYEVNFTGGVFVGALGPRRRVGGR